MQKVVKNISLFLTGAMVITGGQKVVLKNSYRNLIKESEVKYIQEIFEYNRDVNYYAYCINKLNLNDLEIIMKVMNDTWNEIRGYGLTKEIIYGYYRLSFQEEGKGVCTSFADDFTAKMNAINPKYNAKNIFVYMNDLESGNTLQRVDIQRNVLEKPEITEDVLKKQQKNGNHMLSVVEIPEYNLHLVVDPTNLLIGYLKDGKIIMLNTNQENFMEYKVMNSLTISEDSFIKLIGEYCDTFTGPTLNHSELQKMYGYEAQDYALETVEELPPKKIKKIYY